MSTSQSAILFAPDATTATLDIDVVDDGLFEGAEFYDVVLTTIDGPLVFQVEVLDSSTPKLTVVPGLGVLTEGDTTTVKLTSDLTPVNPVAFTVRAQSDEATVGADVSALDDLVVLAPGATETSTASVTALDDDQAELFEERFTIAGFAGAPADVPVGAAVLTSRVMRVIDNEAYLQFRREPGAEAAPTLHLEVTEPTDAPLEIVLPIDYLFDVHPYFDLEGEIFLETLDPATDGGVATRDVDFSVTTTPLGGPTGSAALTLTIAPDDLAEDGPEHARLGLRHEIFCDCGFSQRVDDVLELVITDGPTESQPFVFDTSLTLNDTVTENSGEAQLTVRRQSPSDAPATLRIVTVPGTADELTDFIPVDTTVVLDATPFQTATVDIDIVDDLTVDSLQLEDFTVQVFHTDSGLADAATTPVLEKTFTIEDDDAMFAFEVPAFNVERPSVGTRLIEVPVQRRFADWPLAAAEPITLRASFDTPGAAAGATFVLDEIVVFDGAAPPAFLIDVTANAALPAQTLSIELDRAPRFVGPQVEWNDAVASLIITPATPASSIGDDIRDAIATVAAGFTSWTPQFDLTVDHAAPRALPSGNDLSLGVAPSNFELPAVTGDLGELLELGPAAGLLEPAAFDAAADTLEALLLDLEANGCVVDFVAGGIGGRPDAASGDVVQTTCSIAASTVDPTGDSPLNDTVSELYQWLIDQPRTLGDLTVDGTLGASITVGVDASGAYVAGSTGLRLDMAADGSLVTSSGGQVVASASGTASADFEVGLRLDHDPIRRVRVDQLGDAIDAGLAPSVAGTAEVSAQANNDSLQLSGEYTAGVTTAPDGTIDVNAITTFTGVVDFDLPRRASEADPTPDPTNVEIQVIGTLSDAGLELVGTYDGGTDLLLDGFDITEARIETTLTAADTTAPLLGRLRVEANDGFAPIEVGVDIRVEPGRLRGTATFSDDTADFGLFQLDQPRYSISIDTNPGLVEPALRFGITADRLVATTGGTSVIEAIDVAGSFTSSAEFSFTFAEGTLGDDGSLFRFDIGGLTIQSPDAAGIILRADVIEAPLPILGETTTATVRDLVVDTALRIGASAVEIDQGPFAEEPTVVAGILPITLAALRLEFTSRNANGFITDLEQFTLAVDAFVADDAYAGWPFDPVVQLGGAEIRPDSPPAERAISFTAAVDSIDPLVVRPIDLGPISLGIENFGAARDAVDGLPADDGLGFVFDGIVTVDGYRDGLLLPGVEGLFTVSRDGSPIPEQEVSVTGEFITDETGLVGLDLGIGFGFDLDLRPVIEPDEPGDAPTRGLGAVLEDFEFLFNLEFGAAVSPDSPQPGFNFSFDGVRAARLQAPFGDLFEIAATDIDVFLDGDTLFSGQPSALLMTVGGDLADSTTGASIVAGDALGPLAGWGGHVGNFGLTVDGQLVALDGFFVGLTVPDDPDTGLFGLPAWLPLFVDDVAVEFGDLRLDELPTLQELGPELLDGIKVRVSGGLRGTELFPISASVDDLVVDLGKLAAFDPTTGFNGADFPIENLSGVEFGIQPSIDFGGFVVGGTLTFGEADITLEGANGDPVATSVLYGRIAGFGESPVISGGVDLVVTEHGPVLLKVTAPLGVPIGPTGFVLTDVTGAATFGDVQIPVPDLGQPEQLLGALSGNLPTDIDITDATIAAAITPSVQNARPTWDDGFALAVAGHLSNVAAGGLAEGDVTLAVTVGAPEPGNIVPGVQAIGFGTLEVFGIEISESIVLSGEVGRAGIMFDLTDVAAPRIDLAFETPAPGSPVGLIFPARATVAAQLDLQGVPAGVQAGLRAVIEEAGPALGDLVEQFVVDNPSSAFALVFAGDDGAPPIARLRSLLARDPGVVIQTLLGIVRGNIGAVADTLGVIQQGARVALLAAGDEFDPSFVFAGVLQPTLLGIPLGEPETEVQVTIDKNNIGFVATGSIIEALKDQVGMYTLSGDLAGGLFALSTLNTTDRVTFGVQIPVPDLRGLLLDGGALAPIDPANSATQFAVTIEGDLTVAGMTMSVGGFFTAPDNANFVDTLVQKRFELPANTPVDPDRVQITRSVDYDNLIERGGLMLYGRLQVPRLVTDPVGVALGLPDIPEDVSGALAWFDEFGTQVTTTEEPISATLLVPGLPALGASPTANEAAIDEWMDTVSLTGVLDGTARTRNGPRVARLLSMPIGQGRLVATTAGFGGHRVGSDARHRRHVHRPRRRTLRRRSQGQPDHGSGAGCRPRGHHLEPSRDRCRTRHDRLAEHLAARQQGRILAPGLLARLRSGKWRPTATSGRHRGHGDARPARTHRWCTGCDRDHTGCQRQHRRTRLGSLVRRHQGHCSGPPVHERRHRPGQEQECVLGDHLGQRRHHDSGFRHAFGSVRRGVRRRRRLHVRLRTRRHDPRVGARGRPECGGDRRRSRYRRLVDRAVEHRRPRPHVRHLRRAVVQRLARTVDPHRRPTAGRGVRRCRRSGVRVRAFERHVRARRRVRHERLGVRYVVERHGGSQPRDRRCDLGFVHRFGHGTGDQRLDDGIARAPGQRTGARDRNGSLRPRRRRRLRRRLLPAVRRGGSLLVRSRRVAAPRHQPPRVRHRDRHLRDGRRSSGRGCRRVRGTRGHRQSRRHDHGLVRSGPGSDRHPPRTDGHLQRERLVGQHGHGQFRHHDESRGDHGRHTTGRGADRGHRERAA